MLPRRAALLSTPCLWLVGLTLFLPTVKACSRVASPALLIGEAPLWNGFMLSPFLVAELLMIVLLVPLLARHEPTRRHFRLALALVIPAFSSPALFVYAGCDRRHQLFDVAYGLAGLVSASLAAILLVVARRRQGWPRMLGPVAAFTLVTLPITAFLVQIAITDGPRSISIGAYTFLAGMLGLALLTIVSVRAITRA